MDDNQKELIYKFQMFEQQIKQLQQQLQAVEENTGELISLADGLETLKGKKGEEIRAPIGRGIFVKANLLSEDLIVDVGGKNFVKKDINSTKKLITDQIGKLGHIKADLENSLEQMNEELMKVMVEVQQMQRKK